MADTSQRPLRQNPPALPEPAGRGTHATVRGRGDAGPADGSTMLSLRETLSAFWCYARPHRGRLTAAGLLLAVSGAMGLTQPLVVQRIIADVPGSRAVNGLIGALVVLVVAGAVVNGVGNYLLASAAEGVVFAARRSVSAHMLRLPMAAFRRQTPGDLLSRTTGDTTLLRQIVMLTLVQAVTGGLTVVGALCLMAVIDVVLIGVSLLVIVVLLALICLVLPRMQRASLNAQRSVGDMGRVLDRALTAFTTVKSTGAEQFEATRVTLAAEGAYRHGLTLARWSSLTSATAGLAAQIVFLAVLGVGGLRVGSGAISVAELVSFLLYVLFLTEPVLSIVAAGSSFQIGRAAMQRVGEVTRLPVEPRAGNAPRTRTAPRRTEHGRGNGQSSPMDTGRVRPDVCVRFDAVDFTYPGRDSAALHGFSLAVPATGLTALVGPSGAGKTTVLNLIERFYDPDGGTVLFDDIDTRAWNLHALRAEIGYVEQDAPVMAGTLRENLAYAAGDIADEDLFDALRTTRLQPLLHRLGGDLDARIEHRGVSLSGGERQRVAIARALLRRPRLLLMDEATSQLDAVNEAALRDAVAELADRIAVLTVAHRLSTVRGAARIAVVQDGAVRAIGDHDALLHESPLYRRLTSHQFSS